MDYVIVWFILTGGMGSIPLLEVRAPSCGRAGAIVGVQVDRVVNPTAVLWPDPQVVGQHCRTDISARVAGLPPGEYHIATTIVTKVDGGRFIAPDPHTSPMWSRRTSGSTPPPPARVRVVGVDSRP